MTCTSAESHTADSTQHCLGPFRWSLLSLYLWQAGWGGLLPLVTDQPGLYWRQMNLHKWFKVSESAHTHTPLPCETEGHGQRATTNEWSGMVQFPFCHRDPLGPPVVEDHTRRTTAPQPHSSNYHSGLYSSNPTDSLPSSPSSTRNHLCNIKPIMIFCPEGVWVCEPGLESLWTGPLSMSVSGGGAPAGAPRGGRKTLARGTQVCHSRDLRCPSVPCAGRLAWETPTQLCWPLRVKAVSARWASIRSWNQRVTHASFLSPRVICLTKGGALFTTGP